jgi:competence protein ComEC
LDVGQGDAFVINIPEYGRVMIDTGADYQSHYLAARKAVFPRCDITSVFITHYDSDHAGGLARLNRYCRALPVYDTMQYGDVVHLGTTTKLYVLSPPDSNPLRTINDNSLVFLLKHREFEALLTGDAGLAVLEPVAKLIADYKKQGLLAGDLDVYKLAHHGSSYNTSAYLLEALHPVRCVVSVGRNNYGHPSSHVIQAAVAVGCLLHRTDTDGTLTLTSAL